MGFKKYVRWLIMFSLLLAFTVNTLSYITGHSTNIALAETIQKDKELKSSNKFIVVKETPEQRRYNRFLKKFARYYDRNWICSLDSQQYQGISQLYDTSLETLPLSSGNVSVVKVSDEQLSRHDLDEIIEDTNGGVRCRVIKFNKILYVLFGAHIS